MEINLKNPIVIPEETLEKYKVQSVHIELTSKNTVLAVIRLVPISSSGKFFEDRAKIITLEGEKIQSILTEVLNQLQNLVNSDEIEAPLAMEAAIK